MNRTVVHRSDRKVYIEFDREEMLELFSLEELTHILDFFRQLETIYANARARHARGIKTGKVTKVHSDNTTIV